MQIVPSGSLSTGSSTGRPVQLLTMMCADHQGVMWNMVGVGDAVLVAGSSGGAASPNGP